MDRFKPATTRRRVIQGLTGIALSGGAASLRGHASAADKQAWLTLPPTPPLPPTDRSGLAEVNGTRLFYAQFGQGEPVLLLHGGMGSSNYWGYQIESLCAKTNR